MNFQIAIPSHERVDTLKKYTIEFLRSCGVGRSNVTIFVNDSREASLYKNAFKGYRVVNCEAKGIGEIRNFIATYYPEGTQVLSIDDDIKYVVRRNDKYTSARFTQLNWLVNKGFSLCKEHGTEMWGIYPIVNPYFMREGYSKDLKYIIAALYGTISNHDSFLQVTMDDKEDYERSIKYYLKFGSIIRINDIGVKTSYYTEPGGLQTYRTKQTVAKNAFILSQRYPQLCSLNLKKKSGFAEVRLRDKRRGKR